MSVVLIDYQNVSDHGLEGAEFLKEKDTLLIFTDANNKMIRQDHIDQIESSGCIFHCIMLKVASVKISSVSFSFRNSAPSNP